MKKNVILFLMILCQSVAMAQYNVGSSITKQTDIFGNTTTVHKDHYGNTTGTSITQKLTYSGIPQPNIKVITLTLKPGHGSIYYI